MDQDPADASISWSSRLKRLGPTIIVAAVVLGPGSIVNASRIGCQFGYSLLWVVPMAGFLMAGMTIAAMMIGVFDDQTPCQRIANRFGRPAAWLVGGSLFVAITLYQASNNNAMTMALDGLTPGGSVLQSSPATAVGGLAVFNGIVIATLMAGRVGLYKKLERAMTILVGVMLLAFTASMIAAQPSIGDVLGGLVPQVPSTAVSAGDPTLVPPANLGATDDQASVASNATQSWLGIAALIATTFSVAGAFFQTYQAREKGWRADELRLGVFDAVIGIGTLSVMTMILFVTAAAALHGVTPVSELTNATAVAAQMEPMFGNGARFIFSVGVLAGAISSFVVNALIGGVALVDAIGRPCRFDSPWVRASTVVALLAGFCVAAAASLTGVNLVNFIVVAQSLTVLAFPILATTILAHLWSIRSRGVASSLLVVVSLGTTLVYAMSVRTIWLLLGW